MKKITTRLKAYSLLEMMVVLMLTSLIMISLISLVSNLMKISANTHARTQIREDVFNLVQEFEKDIKNASLVGKCEGDDELFQCDFFSNNNYRWQTCPRIDSSLCTQLGSDCDRKDIEISLCKYRLNSSGNTEGEAITRLNDLYNLDKISVNVLSTADNETTSTRRSIALTVVTSHPNKRLNINGIIRQTIVSAKNFELTIDSK